MQENPPSKPSSTDTQAQNTPSQVQSVPQTNPLVLNQAPSDNTKPNNSVSKYILALIMFILGTGLGIFLFKEFPQENKSIPANISPVKSGNLIVPKDAVQIEACEDTKGALFIEPQNIPQGPIYMSYKGKVVGVEFMLDLNQIMKDGKFDFLSAQNVNIDHIKFGYLSQGHEGNPVPHFHADLYTVSRKVEEAIKCPPGQSQMNMPGMNMEGSTNSATLTPQPSGMQIRTTILPTAMQMLHTNPTISPMQMK